MLLAMWLGEEGAIELGMFSKDDDDAPLGNSPTIISKYHMREGNVRALVVSSGSKRNDGSEDSPTLQWYIVIDNRFYPERRALWKMPFACRRLCTLDQWAWSS